MQLAISASTAVLFTVSKALEQSVVENQFPVSCDARALSITCSAPSGTYTPTYLLVDLLQMRPPLSHVAPAVKTLHHVVPTRTGRQFSLNAAKVDHKKSHQNAGINASGSSTILRQKLLMLRSNSSCPISAWMMGDCRCANR